MPVLRAMPLIFPDERNVDNMIYQYMYGENLLVGVFSDSIYLPKGTWINYWTGEKMSGGKTVHCKVPENRGGLLFIRGGAIIPFQKTMQYVDEYPNDTLFIKVFPERQSSYILWEDDGKTFDFEKGNISKTSFECNDTDKETDFNISPCQGTYSGIIGERTFSIEIVIPEKPIKIMVNNQIIERWEYDKSGKVIVFIHRNKLAERETMQIFKKN
jgi:alpha-glucosidase (family GH31 glycosyl hydrolase)